MIVIKKLFCAIFLLISEFSFAEVKELTCSYGIKFWYHYDDSAPIVNLVLAFKNSGSAYLPSETKTIPILYSNSILCGCGKLSKEEFTEKLHNLSVRLYVDADSDAVLFFLKYPKIISSEATSLFRLMLTSPKFPKKELEKSKLSLCYYMKNYQVNPFFWGNNFLIPKILFKGHAYGESLGETDNVLKITSKNLKAFHKKHIVRSNIEFCVFGDISEQNAKKLVDSILFSIPKGEKFTDNIPDIEPKYANIHKNYYIEGPQSYIFFALPNVLKNSPDRFAAAVLYLTLGGDNFKSRILKRLRSDLGLIYSGGVSKLQKNHSCFEIGFLQTSNKNVSKAIEQIKLLLKDLREKGITKEELAFAKSNIKGTFLVNLRTATNLCSFYMDQKLKGHSTNSLDEFLNGIDSVTLEQVNSLAKKLINENNMPILVFGGNK